MINITLPDEKSNYVHRIGRVGRAERMGLAISLVSKVPEKVWYHGEWCPSRGKKCQNTNLTDQAGCCVWYNEPNVSVNVICITCPFFSVDQSSICFYSLTVFSRDRRSSKRHDPASRRKYESADERLRWKGHVRAKEIEHGYAFHAFPRYSEQYSHTCLLLGSNYQNHVQQMAPYVKQLSSLESKTQLLYLKRHMTTAAN